MSLFFSTPIRFSLMLVISTLLVSGCSSSSDSNSAGSQPPDEMEEGITGSSTSGSLDESTTGTDIGSGIGNPSATRVNFNITVPVIFSDALQVRLVWGDIDTTAMWNNSQFWTASIDFPVNMTNQLIVTFSDGNGATTLGSFERSFRTSTNQSESFQIAADEFDTSQWDSDGDGVSNLDELIAGNNPVGDDLPQPVQASLEILPVKTFRITWQSTGAQFYRVFENPDGVSGFTDISGELEADMTNFDHQVALYSRVNAQYLVQSCNDQGCVDSRPVMVTGTLDNAIGHFKASNTGLEHRFGFAVSLSADGNTLAVGASDEESAATGINGDQTDISSRGAGAVYVFVRSNGLWEQQAYVKASNAGQINFGFSVSLSVDGNTLAVGAPFDNNAATGINSDQTDILSRRSGAVYVFVRSNGLWRQQAYIKASNTDTDDGFGGVVSLSADSNTLAVRAGGEDSAAKGIDGDQFDNSSQNAGAVYVFVRTNGLWQQQAYIKASNTDRVGPHIPGYDFDGFGDSVSLSADGNTLAVGAEEEESAATGINGDQADNSGERTGAVYVFIRSSGLWQQQAYIKASNTDNGDRFGSAVSLNANGNTLVVGAHGEDSAATGMNGDQTDNSSSGSGAVYVFVRSNELWEQQAYLKASNTGSPDVFGADLSLSANGNRLAVGAERERSAAAGINGDQADNSVFDSGAVYTFVRSNGLWEQQAYIKAPNTSPAPRFGSAVSLSADGKTLAVGADEENSAATGINGDQPDNRVFESGAVYLY